VVAALRLTGHFLARDVQAPHGLKMPDGRERVVRWLASVS